MRLQVHRSLDASHSRLESLGVCIPAAAQQGNPPRAWPWTLELAEQPFGERVEDQSVDLEAMALREDVLAK